MTTLKCVETEYGSVMHVGTLEDEGMYLEDEGVKATIVA